MEDVADAHEPLWPPPGAAIARLVLGLLAAGAVIALLGTVLRAPVEAAALWFIGAFGGAGVFAGMFVLAVSPLPVHDAVLLAAIAGGVPMAESMVLAPAGAVVAGWACWWLGRTVGARWPGLRRLARRYGIEDFLERWGTAAIAIAAIAPVPFALVVWTSGATHRPFRYTLVGSFFRVPKIVITLWLYDAAWSLGG